eukprot:1257821-Amphidinium_carterae.1
MMFARQLPDASHESGPLEEGRIHSTNLKLTPKAAKHALKTTAQCSPSGRSGHLLTHRIGTNTARSETSLHFKRWSSTSGLRESVRTHRADRKEFSPGNHSSFPA